MPRIDFYVLPDQTPNGRLLLACKLSEKAYHSGYRVYLHTSSAEQARTVDDLLWTFRQGSFIPHALYPASADDRSPVLIGLAECPPELVNGVVVNLGQAPPPDFERFERVIEVVDQEPETLAFSRDRFRFYRERGLKPTSHKL
ncbi:MAG: DNA polymerase III subunit chi [Candidatus Competibacteraceae bacterium]|nr:DNA polymerase III subunit chi [Candidatus Competibacteraceae bacterium]